MKYYVGLDLHSATFTLAVINEEGQVILTLKKPTSEYNLIEVVEKIRQKAKVSLVVEESHMAGWCQDVIKRHCDEFVICNPCHNALISRAEFCNDKQDAIKLARLLRAGFIKPIIHQEGHLLERRELFLHYNSLTVKNAGNKTRLKARFRMNAINATGKSIYNLNNKDKWLKLLDDNPAAKFQADQYYDLIEKTESLKDKVIAHLLKDLRSTRDYKVLTSFPGIGEISATGIMCIIGNPRRFSRKNKLWKYAGFGIKSQSSDNVTYTKQASKTGNRVLKGLISEVVRACLKCKSMNSFKAKYMRFITKGVPDKIARRTIARDILSATRRAWINGECYRNN